ncbi:CLUMA_CG017757, isoform A [Clunio marinus]|uniref:CLUMA_CG017757, isoform A n=1 Tax=Clunio marinus TaxID=568069 RepID=A0A1J1IWV6_9DIPT|nr:CLUMA_CG017757, isoform A [Clunio marinus]
MDSSQLSFKEKLEFFEKNDKKSHRKVCSTPKFKSCFNIVTRNKPNMNDSRQGAQGNEKKSSPSTTDNNFVSSSSAPTTSSSVDYMKSLLNNLTLSSNKAASKNMKFDSNIKNSPKIQKLYNDENRRPDILEVFNDLDKFIEKELNEIETKRRINRQLEDEKVSDALKNVKKEYSNDILKHQKEFEKQMKSKINDKKNVEKSQIELDSIDDEQKIHSINEKMNRLRIKKLEQLKVEGEKQEKLLTMIFQVLQHVTVNEENLEEIMKIERHYLVASIRLQASMAEVNRLSHSESFHSPPFHVKGKCEISEVMLEIKQNYLERFRTSRNEFILVLFKYDGEVIASKPLAITDDIRTIKFSEIFQFSDVYLDFNIRVEIYGTTFWSQKQSIRETTLKFFGFFYLTACDSSDNRQRFDMIEVIKTDNIPLRKKVSIKFKQFITPDIHHENELLVKLGNSWVKTNAVLCGHLLEFSLISDENAEPILLDLHNLDSDFVIPIVSNVSMKPFTFLLKFNHYINDNDFFLPVAAESAEDYSFWVGSINKVLALINKQ